MSRAARYLDVVLFLVVVLTTLYFMQRTSLLADELIHFRQIVRLAAGDYTLEPGLTTIPGYHFAIAQIVRLTGSDSITLLRGANVLLGGACIAVFASCLRLLANGASHQRVAQFAVFPIIFPYFFLIYTDIASLLLVLCGLWLCLTQRYTLAAIVLMLSVAVRQNNVVWLVAIPALAWLQQTSFELSRQNLWAFVRRCWPLAVGLLGFAIFVAANRGVALGDRGAHPLYLGTGNLFFMLFVYSLVFLPLVLARTPENVRLAFSQRGAGLLWAGFAAIYLLTFDSSHPYNSIQVDYFLRNAVLTTFTAGFWPKAAFFIPILLAALDLARGMRERKAIAAIVIATVLVLLPSWLIEQRYYMISFALLSLFRVEGDRRAERLTTLLCALLSLAFVYGIQQKIFFL